MIKSTYNNLSPTLQHPNLLASKHNNIIIYHLHMPISFLEFIRYFRTSQNKHHFAFKTF
jgi:hypothetical protein